MLNLHQGESRLRQATIHHGLHSKNSEKPMTTFTEYMSIDHKHCDDVFAALERNVSEGKWETAALAFKEFNGAMQLHFAMEEDILFPAFEQATGHRGGPTAVMRDEHRQMREIIDELQQALQQADADNFAGVAETLNIMLQQHNMKEEGILYPMADRTLQDDRDSILNAMSKIDQSATGAEHV